MNTGWQSRTELLLGEEALERIAHAHVLCVGLGGVGGIATELLARTAVGRLTIVDGDVVEDSNRNRQLIATTHSVGQSKAEAMAERLLSINPALDLQVRNEFLKDDNLETLLDAAPYDCVLDAIDTLAPKVHLIAGCLNRNLPVVSSMGSGARKNPECVRCADLDKTFNCTLAKAVRQQLHRLGLKGTGCRAVFSTEPPIRQAVFDPQIMENNKRSVLGTISYMPTLFGCHCAAEVLRLLSGR
ncbi:MAG: tRNA threonylcarbamoyladenosine dehydratase [Victivallales bacterium]